MCVDGAAQGLRVGGPMHHVRLGAWAWYIPPDLYRCMHVERSCRTRGRRRTLGTMYMLQGCQSCMRHRSHFHSGNLRATEDVLWPQEPHLNHLFVTCKCNPCNSATATCFSRLFVLVPNPCWCTNITPWRLPTRSFGAQGRAQRVDSKRCYKVSEGANVRRGSTCTCLTS